MKKNILTAMGAGLLSLCAAGILGLNLNHSIESNPVEKLASVATGRGAVDVSAVNQNAQNTKFSAVSTSAADKSASSSKENAKGASSNTAGNSAAGSIACPSVNGALKVSGSRLVDKNGNPVQLKGISTHGIAWFPQYINSDCFKTLKSWGANVIRLSMYTAEYGGYCTGGDQTQLKELIKNGVKYASDNDMYVIVDWHVLNDGNPNNYKEQAKAFFDEMSSVLSIYNNVIYEICNEPCNGTDWQSIKSYAGEVIPMIRKNDSDAVIIVGTPNWSQYVDEAAASPITGYDNLMYSLHFYAATHKEDLQNKLKTAVSAGLPVFVSEFGICDASGNGAVDEASASQWLNLLDSYGISYVCWDLSNKAETASLLNSSCQKTSGFTYDDDLSEEGKWIYTWYSKSLNK